jgi:hypothetical protein
MLSIKSIVIVRYIPNRSFKTTPHIIMRNHKFLLIGLAGTLAAASVATIAPSANAQFNGSLNGNTLRIRLGSPNNTATTTSNNNNGSAQGNANTSPVDASPAQLNLGIVGTATGGAQNGGPIMSMPTQGNMNTTTQTNTTTQNRP